MDSNFTASTPESHPKAMDFLSLAWCNFAVQAFQPDQQDRSVVLLDYPIDKFKSHNKSPYANLDKMDDADLKPPPPWKSNDVKSFIWMQQAMHPELNYTGFLSEEMDVMEVVLLHLCAYLPSTCIYNQFAIPA